MTQDGANPRLTSALRPQRWPEGAGAGEGPEQVRFAPAEVAPSGSTSRAAAPRPLCARRGDPVVHITHFGDPVSATARPLCVRRGGPLNPLPAVRRDRVRSAPAEVTRARIPTLRCSLRPFRAPRGGPAYLGLGGSGCLRVPWMGEAAREPAADGLGVDGAGRSQGVLGDAAAGHG